jgi:hypothetical protein
MFHCTLRLVSLQDNGSRADYQLVPGRKRDILVRKSMTNSPYFLQKTSLRYYTESLQALPIFFRKSWRLFLFVIILLFPAKSFAGEHSLLSGFAPTIGTIDTVSGLAAGVRYKTSLFQGAAAYSLEKYRLVELQFGLNPPVRGFFLRPIRYEYQDVYDLPSVQDKVTGLPSTGMMLYFEYRYRDLTQEAYFGLGADSLKSNRSDFQQTDHSFEFVSGYQFSPRVRFDVRAGYSLFDIGHGTDSHHSDVTLLFDDQTAPGLTAKPDFFHIGPAILIDFRKSPLDPESGGAAGFSFTRFQPAQGKFAFQRYLIDGRYFVPLRPVSSVAAFWLHTSLDSTDGENRVPFYLQETLGGTSTLRGFPEFRFHGEKQIYLSGEYRWNIKPSLQLAGFYDAGKVFERPSDFDFRSLSTSFGGGFRIKFRGEVIFRLDYGHSKENNQIVFRFSPTF